MQSRGARPIFALVWSLAICAVLFFLILASLFAYVGVTGQSVTLGGESVSVEIGQRRRVAPAVDTLSSVSDATGTLYEAACMERSIPFGAMMLKFRQCSTTISRP